MAKLDRLPAQSIIDGLAGVLDFYLWKDIPCVRSWPRKSTLPQTPASAAFAAQFGYLATAFSDTPANIRSVALDHAADTTWTWRDVRYRAAYGNLIAT